MQQLYWPYVTVVGTVATNYFSNSSIELLRCICTLQCHEKEKYASYAHCILITMTAFDNEDNDNDEPFRIQ